MNIGYFVGRFPYSNHVPNYKYGGGEIVAYNLAINMAKRGHTVHVFTTSADRKDYIEKGEKLTIHRYGTIVQFFERNLSLNLIFKPLKHDVNVVHVHVGSSPIELVAALIYARIKKKPLVATYHSDVIPFLHGFIYKGSVHIYNAVVKKVLSHANVIISPSKYYITASIFLKRYGNKIIVIPNGVNIKDFDIPYSKKECREKLGLSPDKNIILFLGVLHPIKGPDVLMKAMSQIISKVPNVELLVGGDGVMKRYLEALAGELGVSHYAKFVGFVRNNIKPMYYKAVDIFCLPSLSESFSLVSLEAMACGTPVVASKVGGIPSIVKDGEDGLLVPPKSPGKLADAIIYLLENEDIRKKLGENARKRAGNYSWEKIAGMTEKVYEQVINKL
jgi:glycosyltransferase involved in cell wall biosynthesis